MKYGWLKCWLPCNKNKEVSWAETRMHSMNFMWFYVCIQAKSLPNPQEIMGKWNPWCGKLWKAQDLSLNLVNMGFSYCMFSCILRKHYLNWLPEFMSLHPEQTFINIGVFFVKLADFTWGVIIWFQSSQILFSIICWKVCI